MSGDANVRKKLPANAPCAQRVSPKPLPHVNQSIQRGWQELCGGVAPRASQRPLPHVSTEIQKGWNDVCSEGAGASIASDTAPPGSIPSNGFDLESFRHFAPMLKASQHYASHTGFRFRSSSFDGLDNLADTLAKVTGPSAETAHIAKALEQDANAGSRLAAKINAAPAMKNIGDRLARGEAELVEELDKAFRIVTAESARNMMVATVKGLVLFPPEPSPEGIDTDDCSYEDVSAPLPVIAQRLFNDHVRRQRDETGSAARQQRRAMTAAFIVDFSHHAGAKLPEPTETYQSLLQEFSLRNVEYMEKVAAKQRVAAEFDAAEKIAELKARGMPTFDDEVVRNHERVQNSEANVTDKDLLPQSGWLPSMQTALWAAAGSAILGDAWKPQKRQGSLQSRA